MADAERPQYPFQATPEELETRLDQFVDATVATLSSFYMAFPRRSDFLEYEPFKRAYLELARATAGFKTFDRATIREAVQRDGMIFTVLRSIAGLSPPDLADYTKEVSGVAVSQSFARSQDQQARRGKNPLASRRTRADTRTRLLAMIDAACEAIERGPQNKGPFVVHRLDKIDTARGLRSLQTVAAAGVEYSMLLYERMLGRPFATYRDSASSDVAKVMEDPVEEILKNARIPYHKSRQGERFAGLNPGPDFLVPDQHDPKAVIEAKIGQDDGTTRDKVDRVQSLERSSEGGTKFEVIACIDGRGFRVRRERMRTLIQATRGRVFTLATLQHLVEKTGLRNFIGTAKRDGDTEDVLDQ
jgi:hypothetical protein